MLALSFGDNRLSGIGPMCWSHQSTYNQKLIMSCHTKNPRSGDGARVDSAGLTGAGNPPRILAVDVPSETVAHLRERSGVDILCVEFAIVDAGLILRIRPDIVLAPLIGSHFDAFDLAGRLTRTGFGGQLSVLSQQIPDLDSVLNEIRDAFPEISVELIVLKPQP